MNGDMVLFSRSGPTAEDIQWLVNQLQHRLECIGDAVYTARCRRLLHGMGVTPIGLNSYERNVLANHTSMPKSQRTPEHQHMILTLLGED